MQEVTAIVGKCDGVVLMAPPRESKEAQATIATLLSAMKSKQKVSPAVVSFRLHITIQFSPTIGDLRTWSVASVCGEQHLWSLSACNASSLCEVYRVAAHEHCVGCYLHQRWQVLIIVCTFTTVTLTLETLIAGPDCGELWWKGRTC